MGSTLLHTVILVGGVQGIITGFLLWFKSGRRPSDRYLASTLWLMSLASLNIYLNYTGIYYLNTTTAIIHALLPMVILMPLGPLIYFYVRAYCELGKDLEDRKWPHFLPSVIDIVPHITAVIYLAGTYLNVVNGPATHWGNFIDQYNVYSDVPRWLSLTCYLILARRFLARFKIEQPQLPPRFLWLSRFITVFLFFQVLWLIYLIPYIMPQYTEIILNTLNWYPIYVPMAVLIYWLGIKGYMKANSPGKGSKLIAQMSPGVVEQTLRSLQSTMETDHLFANPELSLHLLSRHIGIPEKTISAVLNQHIGKSFTDYVNGYRVDAIKQKLHDPQLKRYTIVAVAMQCGFNSKASFQRVFKQHVGVSPNEFRKRTVEATK